MPTGLNPSPRNFCRDGVRDIGRRVRLWPVSRTKVIKALPENVKLLMQREGLPTATSIPFYFSFLFLFNLLNEPFFLSELIK